jgi:cupin 2 domain-containing protein
MKLKNIFSSIPDDLDDENIDLLLRSENVKIERIISKGHVSPATGWYDQKNDEWVLVLKGAAIIAFENDRDLNLVAGDYVNIPAHTRHKVKWTDPDAETIWLAIHY